MSEQLLDVQATAELPDSERLALQAQTAQNGTWFDSAITTDSISFTNADVASGLTWAFTNTNSGGINRISWMTIGRTMLVDFDFAFIPLTVGPGQWFIKIPNDYQAAQVGTNGSTKVTYAWVYIEDNATGSKLHYTVSTQPANSASLPGQYSSPRHLIVTGHTPGTPVSLGAPVYCRGQILFEAQPFGTQGQQ